MQISLLKKLNNSLPDPIKSLFAPMIRRQLICSPVFRDQMTELETMGHMTSEEINDLQFQKLKKTVVHAYEHTQYYKSLFDNIGFDAYHFQDVSELKRIPLLTKPLIAENYEALQADDIMDAYIGETGGSTGEPLRILLSRESIYKEKAFIYHFWSQYGYDYRKSRVATFRGVEFQGKLSKPNPLYNEVLLNPFLLNEGNVQEYVSEIENFRADFIHGYPSSIANFCRLLDICRLKINKPVKAVFLISESCSPKQKEIIEQVLGCKVAVFYGHTERSVFAEAYKGTLNYHFHPLYGYTEVETHPYGNIICTGFLNAKFPLIRYAVDDEATSNGIESYTIEGHRTGTFLYGMHGEWITQTALNFHDDTFSSVAAYQLYQDSAGYAECRVQGRHKLTNNEIGSIYNNLISKCGGCIQWKVVPVTHFELTERGKFKTIIQKCEEEIPKEDER